MDRMSKERRDGGEPQKCRFYLSEGGYRKGKECRWSHDQKDGKRRCWNCGAEDHLVPSCPRPKGKDGSPKKIAKMEVEETASTSTKKKAEDLSEPSSTSSMKDLMEEANKMLKNLSPSPSSSGSKDEESKEDVMQRLQQQLNSLRQKTLRLGRMTQGLKPGTSG